MALYDYRCDSCGIIEEKTMKMADVLEDTSCGACAAGNMTRIISAAPLHFRGEGFTSNLGITRARKDVVLRRK